MSLPDKTYRRTLQGSAEMRAMPTNLPRKLRGLLSLIDGQTPSSKLASFLTNFGDVEALLEALEINGLIEEVSHGPAVMPAEQAPPPRRAMDENPRQQPYQQSYAAHSPAPAPAPVRYDEQVSPDTRPLEPAPAAPQSIQPPVFEAAVVPAAAPSASQTVDQVLDIRDVRNLLADALAEVFSDEAMVLSMQVEKATNLQELKQLAPHVVALLDSAGSDRLKTHANEFQLISNR